MGRLSGSIVQTSLEGVDFIVPKDYQISIYGLYSGCVASETAVWQPAD
jgi:hypothetical protein